MANNCVFEIRVNAKRAEDAERMLAVLQDRDPEYCIIRSWPGDVHMDWQDGAEMCISGICPWTGDYMWRPENTLYGHGIEVGGTVFDDGRIPVSVPWMCRQWDMSAYGYEEEPGCDVDGEYSCGPDGVLTYRDTSGPDREE